MSAASTTNLPKEIIVLCDGTGDSPEATDRSRTNVQILHQMLAIGVEGTRKISSNPAEGWEIDQFKLPDNSTRLVYYDRGLGAPVAENGRKQWWNPLNLVTQSMNTLSSTESQLKAVGITINLKQSYKFLARNYKPGDKIYLFGFSRGSYTQRLLVTLIRYIGLLDGSKFPTDAELDAAIEKGFSLYDTNIHPDLNPNVAEFKKNCHETQGLVHYLGLWDTVRGMVAEEVRQDARLSSVVKVGRHALAIDEEREIFKPELWIASEGTDSKQVWFSGEHCDIGGGFRVRDLANTALRWMLDEAAKVGLKIDEAAVKMFGINPLAKQHDSLNTSIIGSIKWSTLGKIRRPVLQTTPDETLHPSVLQRFGKAVKKGEDNVIYKPSVLAHMLTAYRNFRHQVPAVPDDLQLPHAYELDDVGESSSLIPVPSTFATKK